MFRWTSIFILAAVASLRAFGAAVSIDSFTYEKPATVWKAAEKSPAAASAGTHGVIFSCPFDKDLDRVYWDRDLSLNLAGYTSFALDLSCDHPEALRGLGLYLRSGGGWYVWNKPLNVAGRQTLTMRKADFTTEGKPAGWDRIDRIRFSPWRGTPVAASLTFFNFTARKDSVVVLRSTISAPSTAERAYAARICNRVSKLLEDRGIPHTVMNEDDAANAIATASLVILPYNAEPPSAELASLKRCLDRGGKLMVFFSQSAALAAMMQVKLGDLLHVEDLSHWRSFAFVDPKKWHVPTDVFQLSQSVRPAYPADNRGEIIAMWRDASGKATREPAWVSTPRGMWMSHILLDDDIDAKSRMMLGLCGALDPSLLAGAAQHAIIHAGKIDGYADFNRAAAGIRAQSSSSEVEQRIAVASAAYKQMLELNSKGDYRGALDAAEIVHAQIIDAFAMAQSPKAGEFRGVWCHDGVGWWPGNWDASCRVLAQRGMNVVFPNLLWGGNAHFPNKSIPTSMTMKLYGDQAALVTKAAHANGLQAHLWVVCCNMGHAPDDFVKRLQKEGRTQVGADGKPTTWLNLAHPKNQEMLLNAITEAVQNYPFDGVHLDYIRYPGAEYDYSPTTRQLFEAAIGEKVPKWPANVRPGGTMRAKFVSWRASQITAFVKRIHDTVKAINPKLQLSAAVWGGYPDTIASIAQDWGTWIKNGYVDFVCPMDYAESLYQFSALVTKQLALPNAAGRIYPGIGVTADESQLQPDQVIEQIVQARRLGATGFTLFEMKHSLHDETLPALSRGTTAR